MCFSILFKADLRTQSADKPRKPSRPKRNSNAQPAPLMSLVQQRPPRELVSNQAPAQQQQLSQMNISPRTRSCSCGICPTTPIKRALLPSLAVSRGSRKSDWYLGGKESLSSSMRTNLELSVRRKLRPECLWEMLGSLFGLPTRDSKAVLFSLFIFLGIVELVSFVASCGVYVYIISHGLISYSYSFSS